MNLLMDVNRDVDEFVDICVVELIDGGDVPFFFTEPLVSMIKTCKGEYVLHTTIYTCLSSVALLFEPLFYEFGLTVPRIWLRPTYTNNENIDTKVMTTNQKRENHVGGFVRGIIKEICPFLLRNNVGRSSQFEEYPETSCGCGSYGSHFSK